MKKTIGQRIKERREELGITQEFLAKSIGVGQSSIGNYESGIRLPKNIHKIADVLKVKISWLESGVGAKSPQPQEIDLENNTNYPAIKKVHLTVSAGITGFGVEPCEGDDSIIVFKSDWYISRGLKPEKLLAVKVSGSSMEPKLYHGDSVVFNTADVALKDGVVYVFNLDGEVVIKRAIRDGGMWWLDSDNPDKARYPRKACTSELCMPLGRVVHMQSEKI